MCQCASNRRFYFNELFNFMQHNHVPFVPLILMNLYFLTVKFCKIIFANVPMSTYYIVDCDVRFYYA